MIRAVIVFLFALMPLASGQSSCGNDIDCLSKLSQYVVLGTVLSNTKGDPTSSPSNYSASINIKCAFLSFSSTGPDRGDNLVGNTVNVFRFGGNNKCPGVYKDAEIGSTQIFFIAVRSLRPLPGAVLNYEVVDICVGGIDSSNSNLQEIGRLMQSNPNNVIPVENQGKDSVCAIATSVTTTDGTQTAQPSLKIPDSASSLAIAFALQMFAVWYVLQ